MRDTKKLIEFLDGVIKNDKPSYTAISYLTEIKEILEQKHGTEDELALIENLADIDWLTQEDMMCLKSIYQKLGGVEK